LLVLVTILYGRGVLDAVGSHAILAQVVFVVMVTVVADLAGAALHAPQRAWTVGMSTRNIGAALALLAAIEPDPRAVVMMRLPARCGGGDHLARAGPPRHRAPRSRGFLGPRPGSTLGPSWSLVRPWSKVRGPATSHSASPRGCGSGPDQGSRTEDGPGTKNEPILARHRSGKRARV
jgi:hypothetical protein